ncbi:hypothetical protein SDC9_197728 [bioreactor metagenome]|uniref:Uncharacterized protein n=1 Tax=bioreactor metagenome TaxID=1076179 RepID=A0A645IGY2_9ZZZZ
MPMLIIHLLKIINIQQQAGHRLLLSGEQGYQFSRSFFKGLAVERVRQSIKGCRLDQFRFQPFLIEQDESHTPGHHMQIKHYIQPGVESVGGG